MSDVWTQAIYATPPLIGGRRLLPFSLAHAVLLRALGNPYAYVDASATLAQLVQALDVCSRTRAENAVALFSGERPSIWRILSDARRWRNLDPSTADASFRVYIDDFTLRAARDTDAANGDDMAVPSEYHLHRHLCEVEGMGEEQAWNCSVARAWAYFDCWTEWKGGKVLLSPYNAQLQSIQARVDKATASGNQEQADAAWAEMGELVKAHNGGVS